MIHVNGRRTKIVGHVILGTGLAANGAALVTLQGFDRLMPTDDRNFVSFGLVQLDPRPRDAIALQQRRDELLAILREGGFSESGRAAVDLLTANEVLDFELNRWVNETPIGAIFQLGVIVAVIVGVAIVYMVLARGVNTNVSEYATLLAMGYSHAFLYRVVVQQALVLCVMSFIPAWCLSIGLYAVTSRLANIPMQMTVGRTLFVLTLSLVVCLGSAAVALRKLASGRSG